MDNSGLGLQHIVFGTLVVALVFAVTELTPQPGMTGHAMDVISPTSATMAAELVEPTLEGAGLQIIAETQDSTVSFVPTSTLSELANQIETAVSTTERAQLLDNYLEMVDSLPEGPNRDFYLAELASLEAR
jgi:hypothetical protein